MPEDEAKPWPLILTFSAHPDTLHLRSLRSHASPLAVLFQKLDGRWPDLTVKSGQWKASRLYHVGGAPPGKSQARRQTRGAR